MSKNFYKYGIFKFNHLNVSMTAKKITRKQIYMSTVVTLARRNQGHRIKSKVVHDLFLSLLI